MAAKNNKYTSINFNHIYDKTTTTSSSTNPSKNTPPSSSSSSYSAASYSAISSPNKPHGRMLVLTRPTPKSVTNSAPPSSHPQQQPQQQPKPIQETQQTPDQPRSVPGSDANGISLRPLGRTGTGSSLSSPVLLNYEKDKELPPPPLISPKSDKFVPPHLRPGFVRREEKTGPDGRPKSGGHERMRRNGPSDSGMMNRPASSGSRPSSSGWYVSLCFRSKFRRFMCGFRSIIYPFMGLRSLCFLSSPEF